MTALRVAVAVLLLAAIVAVAVGLPLASWIGGAAAWVEPHREAAGAVFVAAYVLAAVLLVPGSILTLAAGFLFGLPLGVALTSVGSVLGAAAAFVVGRFWARDWVAQHIAARPRFNALDAVTRTDGFMIVLLARLSPLIPYNLLNYGLSITAVRFLDYVLATWIGMLPATVLYVYTGSLAKSFSISTSAGRAPSWAAHSLLAIGLAATVALTLLIARRATRVLRERLAAESQPSLPREMSVPSGIAVVIPVLGDAIELDALLAQLATQQPEQVIVVSGRADVAVAAVCDRHACEYVETVANRGAQLDAGARRARAPVLWFVHADAEPPRDALAVIAAAIREGAESGCFRFAFQGPTAWYKRLLAQLVALRISCGGMVYGDQGIFACRDVYLELGGFAEWPLFEEVRLVRRLRARRTFRVLPRALAVATRRWERDGWLRHTLHNRWLALRFALGSRPEALAARYHALLPSDGEHER
jgi:rSAM/selenodomain-associated transferase 2